MQSLELPRLMIVDYWSSFQREASYAAEDRAWQPVVFDDYTLAAQDIGSDYAALVFGIVPEDEEYLAEEVALLDAARAQSIASLLLANEDNHTSRLVEYVKPYKTIPRLLEVVYPGVYDWLHQIRFDT